MTDTLTTRNATLSDLADILTAQHDSKLDLVVPASALISTSANLVVMGVEPVLTDSGVLPGDGVYRLTGVAEQGLASKLGIPLPYLQRMRNELPDLYDANVNGWLGQVPNRKFLVRAFRGGDEPFSGVVRAVLSDSYKPIDHLDTLTAALDGVRQSGAKARVVKCDLTERRMYVCVESEDVAAVAPTLLKDYRSPFSGKRGADNPLVFAGFVLTNSEVGQGRFSLTPRIVIRVCDNGMTFAQDATSSIHLGTRLDEGIVQVSADTMEKQLALITAQARDAVATFMDRGYVERKIRQIQETAGIPVTDPAAVVETVTKSLRFTEAQTRSVLDMFIKGGDPTAGGILQAVTAAAQGEDDADVAFEMEGLAVEAMSQAAALSR